MDDILELSSETDVETRTVTRRPVVGGWELITTPGTTITTEGTEVTLPDGLTGADVSALKLIGQVAVGGVNLHSEIYIDDVSASGTWSPSLGPATADSVSLVSRQRIYLSDNADTTIYCSVGTDVNCFIRAIYIKRR